jgi:hypothetical protein
MDRADHQPGAPHWRGYGWFRICQLHNGGAAQLRQLELLDVVMNVAAGEAMPHDRANLALTSRDSVDLALPTARAAWPMLYITVAVERCSNALPVPGA